MGLQLDLRGSESMQGQSSGRRQNGKFEEGRRHWKKRSCQIFASGTPGGKIKRQCADEWERAKAEKVAAG
jgi:hypothetical protein